MKSESKAIEKLCDSSSKVSAHYFIKYNGKLLNLVPDLYEAWHAGKSSWKNLKGLNKYSIGIEINNPGHSYGYPKFKKKQISTLKKLLKNLIYKYKIRNQDILGHSDIAPDRKKDPGEKFPWKDLANKDLSIWHKLKEKKIKIFRNQKLNSKDKNMFFKNLYKFGYSKMNKNKLFLIKAFQRRFRQSLINGKVDKECFIISKSLTKS
jgi:N-acetylmuramoyl-L-alanine amidase